MDTIEHGVVGREPSDPEQETRSCLPSAGAALWGAAAGAGGWWLAVWARSYCDAAFEPAGVFVLNAEFPMIVTGGALLGLMTLALGRRLAPGRTAGRTGVRIVLVVVATVGLGWWFFAHEGTLDGYPGDSGLCPASNVPPQWPDWIPA
ncbi:hypothetical protein [Streptomyces sp. UH6]|uniref:hypothetical protein n=1 Tax=Streptomyces sp. UH6 TaxID=2748379 RepID=UPI0015D4FE5E|nr:hypothetical protein [Streptomyces sp. UH6]NYV76190.1 hypothetical protein [Streptomyces sp. UH6]